MKKYENHQNAIRAALKARGWSVYRLSVELNGSISRNMIYTYLRGEVGLSVDKLDAINKLLKIRYVAED